MNMQSIRVCGYSERLSAHWARFLSLLRLTSGPVAAALPFPMEYVKTLESVTNVQKLEDITQNPGLLLCLQSYSVTSAGSEQQLLLWIECVLTSSAQSPPHPTLLRASPFRSVCCLPRPQTVLVLELVISCVSPACVWAKLLQVCPIL